MILNHCSQEPHHQRGQKRSRPMIMINPIHISVWITNAGSDFCALHSNQRIHPVIPRNLNHDSRNYLQVLLSAGKSSKHPGRIIQGWRRQIVLSDQGSRISDDHIFRYSSADWGKH